MTLSRIFIFLLSLITFEIAYIHSSSGLSYLFIFSLALFIFAFFTDWLDGWIARKWGCESNWGKIYDPLVDKIVISTFFIVFAIHGIAHWLLSFFSISREITVEWIRYKLKKLSVYLSAVKLSKYKTFLQFLSFSAIFIGLACSILTTEIYNLILIPSILIGFAALTKYIEVYRRYY